MNNHATRSQGKIVSPATNHRWMHRWLLRHIHSLFASVTRLWHAPWASLMTISVVGMVLAMPAGLFVLLQNMRELSLGLDQGAKISLFLKMEVSDQAAQTLAATLRRDPRIASLNYISAAQGLKEFQQRSGLGEVFSQIPNNPLPAVIDVYPALHLNKPEQVAALADHLKTYPEVDTAQMDMAWVKRLSAVLSLAKRFVWALGVLLALAVLLIIGNTLRLSIQNYRTEIEVFKLVGATNAFIARPFLYTGMIYGCLGALCAFLLVFWILRWLNTPVRQLASFYQSHYALHGLTPLTLVLLVTTGIFLGWLGSLLAVWRELHLIEPGHD